MEMHLLFTPNHVQLLNACYPPTSALLTAGPDYSPSSHELSRLTYYASNHPGKLTKIGGELEKRIRSESKKAKAGNIRARALLLISLAILRSLSTECRSDIILLAPSLISSLNATLAAVPQDLEVLARLASVFTAWTTYTNGTLVGADHAFTQEYLAVLQHFATLASCDNADQEIRNRTRLIGFAAVTGALTSEALYNDSVQFRTQTLTLLRPILVSLFQTDLDTLVQQSATVKDAPGSPYLAEFRTRPALERRAASIHIHIDGDNGPPFKEVSGASLRSLFSLLSHAGGAQLGQIMQALFENLDIVNGWTKQEHCCWLARQTVEWAQYQYRYVVPTWLVEKLLENQETPTVNSLHAALAEMVTTVFSSSIPMINLSSSDLMSKLLALVLRRTAVSPIDPLLPSIVKCIASLGCRVYYSDQIQDLAAEIINRLNIVEVQRTSNTTDREALEIRTSSILSLVGALSGLIRVANEHEETARLNQLSPQPHEPKLDDIAEPFSGRTRVSPEIYQDTLSLICDPDSRVRIEYARNLIYYLAQEISKTGEYSEVDGLKKIRRLSDGLTQATNRSLLLNSGDAGSKFLNAVHAYIFILATNSKHLVPDNHPSSSLSQPSEGAQSPENSDSTNPPQPSRIGRARKASLLRRLSRITFTQEPSIQLGTQDDYASITNVLVAVQEYMPIRGFISAVPMLLHLDAEVRLRSGEREAVAAIDNIFVNLWSVIAKNWDCRKLIDLCEAKRLEQSGVDSMQALDLLVSCPTVKDALGLPKENLYRILSRPWDPERALHDFVDSASTFQSTVRGDNLSPLLKISPALMQFENMSMQSLTRSRGLGVTDLREALEGRSSMSNPNLVRPASVISTLDQASTTTCGDPMSLGTMTPSRTKSKRGAPGDVRDVLTKLGIGKQNNNLLKASFPAIVKPANR